MSGALRLTRPVDRETLATSHASASGDEVDFRLSVLASDAAAANAAAPGGAATAAAATGPRLTSEGILKQPFDHDFFVVHGAHCHMTIFTLPYNYCYIQEV